MDLLDLEVSGTTKYPTNNTFNIQGDIDTVINKDILLSTKFTTTLLSLLKYAKETQETYAELKDET